MFEIMWFVFVLLFVLAVLFLIVIPTFKKHSQATGTVTNYDPFMKKFVYKVSLSKQEIIDALKTKNVTDEICCAFDFEKGVIRISDEYNSYIEYYYTIEEYDGFCILKLAQVSAIGMQSYVPYKLNPFMVKKLNAKIVPYDEYRN